MSDVSHPQFSNALAELEARGLVSQVTESNLPEAAAAGQLYVYGGFCPPKPNPHKGEPLPVFALAPIYRAPPPPPPVFGRSTRHDREPPRAGEGARRVFFATAA